MLLLAHHVNLAIELFGIEFVPRTPLEHSCVFGAAAVVLSLAGYGAVTLAARCARSIRTRRKTRLGT